MATFPTLKTGAAAQYPVSNGLRFQNQILRFLDGTDQRYRDLAGPLHTWGMRFNQMDEREMAQIQQFFIDNQGAFANFTLTDPWTGQAYANCSVSSDRLDLTTEAEMNGSVNIDISEHK